MKLKKLLPAIIFAITVSVYLWTACPTLFIGDDGEIVSAAYTLGICHPPGYPVFTMLGKVFSYIPVSNIAFRVNLLAAFFGALSALMLFLCLKKLNKNQPGINALSSLILAFSFIFWSQSLHAKGGIYTLSVFLNLAAFLALMNLKPKTFGLLIGLSLANHQTGLLFLPAFLLYAWSFKREWFTPENIAKAAVFTGLGVLAYCYLYIRANAGPVMNWNSPDTLTKVWKHISRDQYGELTKNPFSFMTTAGMVWAYLKWIVKEITPFLALLLPLGFYEVYKTNRKLFYVLLTGLLFGCLGMFAALNFEANALNTYVDEVFFIPSFVFLAVFTAYGAQFITSRIKFAALAAAVPLLAVIPLLLNFGGVNLNSNRLAYNYGANILKTVEKNGVLFTDGDNMMFVVAYMQYVDRVRTDIKAYDDIGCIFGNPYGEGFLKKTRVEKEQIRTEVWTKAIEGANAASYISVVSSKRDLAKRYKKEQKGVLYRIIKSGNPAKAQWPELKYDLSGIEKYYRDYLVNDIIAQYWYAEGEYLYATGKKMECLVSFEKCAKVGADSQWVPNNLGVTYLEKGFKEKALAFATQSAGKNKTAMDLCNLGVMYYQQGKFVPAEENYRKAMEADPNYPEAYNGLGTVFALSKKPKEALECYEAAIRLKPDYAEAVLNIGILYHQKEDLKMAEEMYRKALSMNKSFPDAHINLGVIYESKGMLDEALAEYKYALEYAPDKPDAYNNIGVIYHRKKMYKEAIEYYEKALKVDPGYVNARKNLGKIPK